MWWLPVFALALSPDLADEARVLFGSEAPVFLQHWAVRAKGLRDRPGAAFIATQIALNLGEKREEGFPLDATAAARTVVDFEAFRYEAHVSGGVFPKRYFGYVDLRWDTAERERELRDVVRATVRAINADEARRGSAVRVTDAEITVTFLAEGGAILLREKQAELDRIHPVLGVGLDDVAIGFRDRPELVRALDEALGTGLGSVVAWTRDGPRLTRFFRFREAIAGTGVMWAWEKELAARKLQEKQEDMGALDPSDQFITASLVYNSGLVFTRERVRQIRQFATGPYLAEVSRANARKRWPLPVLLPGLAREDLLEAGAYPDQPTSWSAVYHVLQRWGAYEALRRFTDTFDEAGAWR